MATTNQKTTGTAYAEALIAHRRTLPADAYLAWLQELIRVSNPSIESQDFVAVLQAELARVLDGDWLPACGGTETPFKSRSGRVLLYVYQASTGRHAYLDVGQDLILTDDEARTALAL